jgi:hypothetical protein
MRTLVSDGMLYAPVIDVLEAQGIKDAGNEEGWHHSGIENEQLSRSRAANRIGCE